MTRNVYFQIFMACLLLVAGSLEARAQREITSNKNKELNVSHEFWQKQNSMALAPRQSPTGVSPRGLVVPKELAVDNIIKQKAKLKEMTAEGFVQPLDYADLASRRMSGALVELPKATSTFVLDVGGSADSEEFSSYSFDTGPVKLTPDSPKYQILKKLADDFDGMKYDLNDPDDRKSIKIRLLSMLDPQAKVILLEISRVYYQEFKIPLRITSLTRSLEYQVQLNGTNANSFVVRSADSFPAHTSGFAMDFGLRQMSAQEQNFLMKKLAMMEKAGKIDAMREGGENAVYHVFVYRGGQAPKI